MKLIDDGNFPRWLRVALFVVGLAIFGGSLALEWLPRWARLGGFLLGFGMMVLGGFTSRAHMLHIKPFDNSYKKARKSYENDDDESNK
ncbi:hypothetical protein [Paraburkholderia sp. CNPSo 3281]|uniref:hypothetical protein n=1 Tax=Paraburkholderia sp. CNPSo 3281 TaxID=2940933 RepID=UPI0020B77020|nr:hypothetical protein [Paraburkholderia sp. CNPSo 3281]MCP3718938.1 hypothetical protein [Paraburkholderia sp. CNPSo 3281]